MDRRRESGVVLLLVLFFALLLTSSIATFLRRSTIDSMIARNRDAAVRAEALASGGVRLAAAILVEDALREATELVPMETSFDPWALVGENLIDLGDGSTLRLRIEDLGMRLNLNALPLGDGGATPEETTLFLQALLEKVIDEMDVPPAEKSLYDPAELSENLIDWLDHDDLRVRGGPEDAYYQEQDPPYRAANRPLLSIEELRLVEGFDAPLVAALEPYVTVYPWAPAPEEGGGINPNTAPPHVLALLFYFDGVSYRLASEEDVRRILRIREEGGLVCPDASLEICTPISQVVGPNPIHPAPSWSSNVFRVEAEARIGDVQRTVEAVLDRSQAAAPRLLSWRVW